jgi:hypothetical protein
MEEQDTIHLTHCFLDTNVFLHFQRFDTVDWPKVLGVQQVCLMLTTTVMEELNHHKDDSKNPGRQKRAKEILSRLEDILPTTMAGVPVSLSQTVTLQELLEAPDVDWKTLKLDPQKGDDYLLASILVFRDANPAVSICFVTNDFPARRKALRWKIPVVNPEGKVSQLEDFSTEAAEQRKKDRELQELRNRLPALTFGFFEATTGNIVQHTTLPLSAPKSETQEIDVLTQAFNAQFAPVQVADRRQQFDDFIKDAMHQTSEENVREYREKYEQYLETFEAACRRDYLQKYGYPCHLAMALHNGGNAVATSVEIVLRFPAGSVVIRAEDEGKQLEVPAEPHPKWLARPRSSIFGIDFPNYTPALLSRNYAAEATYALRRDQQKRKGPICNRTGETHIVTYWAEELLHEKVWQMLPIMAYIWPTTTRGFSINYRIHVKELTRSLKGQLQVRWT